MKKILIFILFISVWGCLDSFAQANKDSNPTSLLHQTDLPDTTGHNGHFLKSTPAGIVWDEAASVPGCSDTSYVSAILTNRNGNDSIVQLFNQFWNPISGICQTWINEIPVNDYCGDWTPGGVLFADKEGCITENVVKFYWDNDDGQLIIGSDSTTIHPWSILDSGNIPLYVQGNDGPVWVTADTLNGYYWRRDINGGMSLNGVTRKVNYTNSNNGFFTLRSITSASDVQVSDNFPAYIGEPEGTFRYEVNLNNEVPGRGFVWPPINIEGSLFEDYPLFTFSSYANRPYLVITHNKNYHRNEQRYEAYPNTRDDSGTDIPVNFLYTNSDGDKRSAPLSLIDPTWDCDELDACDLSLFSATSKVDSSGLDQFVKARVPYKIECYREESNLTLGGQGTLSGVGQGTNNFGIAFTTSQSFNLSSVTLNMYCNPCGQNTSVEVRQGHNTAGTILGVSNENLPLNFPPQNETFTFSGIVLPAGDYTLTASNTTGTWFQTVTEVNPNLNIGTVVNSLYSEDSEVGASIELTPSMPGAGVVHQISFYDNQDTIDYNESTGQYSPAGLSDISNWTPCNMQASDFECDSIEACYPCIVSDTSYISSYVVGGDTVGVILHSVESDCDSKEDTIVFQFSGGGGSGGSSDGNGMFDAANEGTDWAVNNWGLSANSNWNGNGFDLAMTNFGAWIYSGQSMNFSTTGASGIIFNSIGGNSTYHSTARFSMGTITPAGATQILTPRTAGAAPGSAIEPGEVMTHTGSLGEVEYQPIFEGGSSGGSIGNPIYPYPMPLGVPPDDGNTYTICMDYVSGTLTAAWCIK